MALTLHHLSELDLRELLTSPAAFEQRRGLHIEEGGLPPAFVFERALDNLRAAPAWASLLSTRLYLLDGARVVGAGGVKAPPSAACEAEIGYGVAPQWQRRGLGAAGAQALVNDSFAHGVQTVVATTLPDNVASSALLQRIGFVRCGTVEHVEDGLLYRWVRERPAA